MKAQMKKADLVDEISERTGMYKKYVKTVLTALDDVMLDVMTLATEEEPSYIAFLNLGIRIGGKWRPERMVINPGTKERVLSEGRILPYVHIGRATKFRIWNRQKEEEE